MRRIIRKFFWAWDYDKEEEWLNEMSAKGLALVSVCFNRYEFEECQPNEYSCQIVFCDNHAKSYEGRKYIDFIEETGAECVGTWLRWVYFRKKTDGGKFELFSDKDSNIKHLQSIIRFITVFGALNTAAGITNIAIGISDNSSNLSIGLVGFALGALALSGAARLRAKVKRLREERQISE